MKGRRILLIAGILVAILVGLSTGLFGKHESWIAKEKTEEKLVDF
jgi:hypothetical protein